MGFYLRKYVRVGPLRFNLSKSGIGLSAGIKGLRVGTGPRGNYVHMGRHGVYYRTSLPINRTSPTPLEHQTIIQSEPGVEPLREIESGSVLNMVDSSSKSLLEEINRKRRKIAWWPVVGLLSLILIGYLYSVNIASWLFTMGLMASIVGTVYVYIRDQLSKSVVVFYELEEDMALAYQSFHDAFDQLANCARVWHISAEGKIRDWKRHAGANSLVDKKKVILKKGLPPYFKSNISVPTMPAGRQTLYFFPDRVLVVERRAVGAVSYDMLNIGLSQTQFIEEQKVPRDATVVDHTWKYVNKNGGPDRRFNNNYEIPVVLYEDLHLTSDSGLNELFQLSKANVSNDFKETTFRLEKTLSKGKQSHSQ